MLHIAAVLNAAEIAEVRRLTSAGEWIDGRATAGSMSTLVKRNHQLSEDDPAGLAAAAIVLAALARNGVFASAALPAQIAPPLFNRYGVGESYGDHIDSAIRPLQRGRMRLDLSATLFLSDPDDYADGDLVIDTEGAEQRVRLPAGDLILYPAGTIHRVDPVTSGCREACFFWVQSLVRSGEQRDMLFALDAEIQALEDHEAARPSAVRLAALYHNLLRLWADP